MKYLVIVQNPVTGERLAFQTDWFDAEKYNPNFDMIVVDIKNRLICFDGETWNDIEDDYL